MFTFKAFPAIVPLAGRSARRLGPKQALGEINRKRIIQPRFHIKDMASTVELSSAANQTEQLNVRFDQPHLLSALCALNADAYDLADFGIVAMGLDHVVTAYNLWESRLSGLSPANVIGRHFFTEIAPCTNNYMVSLRYEAAELDEMVNYVFSYRLRPVKVRLRLLKSAEQGRQFLVVEREDRP